MTTTDPAPRPHATAEQVEAALKDSNRSVGFPTIVFPSEMASNTDMEALIAGMFVSKYAGIVVLSDLTTEVMFPLLLERSFQAQFLIPMAVSLAFGVLFATVITLFLIPSVLMVADDFRGHFSSIFGRSRPGREYQAKGEYQRPESPDAERP